MTIKYGDITVIYNEEDIISYIFRVLTTESISTSNPQIVILFEDGEICESNDKFTDFEYKFLDYYSYPTPRYIKKHTDNNRKIYFKKTPFQNADGNLVLDFTNFFNNYTKYSNQNLVISKYNSIYYNYKNLGESQIFGIVGLKSSESKPRFQFAYDSDEFTKEEIIYIINYIFKIK